MPSGPDQVDGAQHAAGVIPMAVREHHRVDDAEIDAKLKAVALERLRFGPGIEEDRVTRPAAMGGDQAGQSVRGATDACAGENAHSLAMQVVEFRFDMLGHARQTVGRVVDQDVYLQTVYRIEIGHVSPPSAWRVEMNLHLSGRTM